MLEKFQKFHRFSKFSAKKIAEKIFINGWIFILKYHSNANNGIYAKNKFLENNIHRKFRYFRYCLKKKQVKFFIGDNFQFSMFSSEIKKRRICNID